MRTKKMFVFMLVLCLLVSVAACTPASTEMPSVPDVTVTPDPSAIESTPDPTPTPEPTPMPEPEEQLPGNMVAFKAEDGLTVYADLYKTEDENAPYILLFHQAGWSRGEYSSIAPGLNELGFNCLAVDQRAGSGVNGVKNMTAVEAKELGLANKFPDALSDLKAALLYAKDELKAEKIIIWGSSYSASLAFILANEFPEDISGVLAFSPGEYFKYDGKKTEDYAPDIKCPVFIAGENIASKDIYDKVTSGNKIYVETTTHGSSVLWGDHDTDVWKQVAGFLNSL